MIQPQTINYGDLFQVDSVKLFCYAIEYSWFAKNVLISSNTEK